MSDLLKDYQNIFLDCVLEKATGGKSHAALLEDIIPIGNLGAMNVIEIYQTDYKYRLHDTLGENYEATWACMGDDDFNQMAFAYIKKYPSSGRDLTSYGQSFPDILRDEYKSDELSLVVDLAVFEKTYWQLFHKPSPAPLAFKDLLEFHSLSFEDVFSKKWVFTKSLSLFSSDWKIFELFQKRKSNFSDLDLNDFHHQSQGLLYKNGITVVTKLLDPIQHDILEKMIMGLSPEEAIMEQSVPCEAEIQDLFKFLSSNFFVTDFE